MRALIFISCALAGLFGPPEVLAQPLPTSIVLHVAAGCAQVEAETTFVSELRLRLPEATVMLGNTAEVKGDWRVDWSRDELTGRCRVEVTGRDTPPQALDMPDAPEPGDIELAASQVAWLVSMARVQPDERPPEAEEPTETVPNAPVAEPSPPEETPAEAARPAEPEASAAPPVESEADTSDESKSDAPKPEPEVAPVVEEALPAEPEVDPAQREWGNPAAWTRVGVAASALPGVHVPRAERPIVPAVSFNLIGGHLYGLSGVELGLAYNWETQFMHGAQFAFGFNRVGRYVRGAQLAFGANFNGEETRGVQAAFGFNEGGRFVHGAQLAFGMNAADDVEGVQGAFGLNLAREVHGVQLGAVNLADNVRGAQIGVVNISDSADVPLGLINIVADEPVYVVGWVGFSGLVTVGIQHGGRHLRYLYLGAAKALGELRVFGAGFGVSGHIPFEPFYIDVDVIAMQLSTDDVSQQSFMATTRAVFGWEIAERFALFAGPALNILNTGRDDALGLLPFGFEAPTAPPGSTTTAIWPEVQIGVRF